MVLNITNPATSSVDLVVKSAPFSTADTNDFTLISQTYSFDSSSPTTYSINIPILDDTIEEQHAEYFVVTLENPNGLTITGTPQPSTLKTMTVKHLLLQNKLNWIT